MLLLQSQYGSMDVLEVQGMVDMHMDEKHDLSMADDVGQTVVFRKVISEYVRMGLVDNWDLTSDGDDIREVPSL
jgi:hypothetical protein